MPTSPPPDPSANLRDDLRDDHRSGLRGRPRSGTLAERRGRVLDHAETVFLGSGYHAATMDDIARAAGMSKRTVYQLFASKADMFEALLGDRFCPMTLPMEDHDGPLAERLAGILRRMAGFCLAPRQLAITRLMIAEAPLSRDMATALERLGIGRGNGILERFLADQVGRGLLQAEAVQRAGNMLFFMALGEEHLNALFQLGSAPPAETLDSRIRFAVRVFLDETAVRPGGGPG